MSGWIKLHRKLLDSSIFDNPNLLKMWLWCLLKASHKGYKQMVGLDEIEIEEGQFITGRNKGSSELNLNPSTFYKYLKALEKLQMIELKSNNKMTVVTIVNWAIYQGVDVEVYQPNNNKVTTKEQQSNTNKNVKKDKNVKNKYIYIVEYLNTKTNKNFKSTSKATQRFIDARVNEGFTLDDFKRVIDIKTNQWIGGKMDSYLRPQTLFGTKFESYLNEGGCKGGKDNRNNVKDEYEGLGLSFEDLQEMQD